MKSVHHLVVFITILVAISIDTTTASEYEKVETIIKSNEEDNLKFAQVDYRDPFDIAIDPLNDGRIYITDFQGSRIFQLIGERKAYILAGTGDRGSRDGPLLSAQFHSPSGIVSSLDGYLLFVCDFALHTIRKIDLQSNIVSTFAGKSNVSGFMDGDKDVALFNAPIDIEIDHNNGNLYVSDSKNHAIRLVTRDGNTTTVAGNGTAGWNRDSGPGKSVLLNFPKGIKNTFSGSLLFVDGSNHAIRKFDIDTGIVSTIYRDTNFTNLFDIQVDEFDANIVYIVDSGDHSIKKLDQSESIVSKFVGDGKPGNYDGLLDVAQLSAPRSIVYQKNLQRYLVTESGNQAIRSFSVIHSRVSSLTIRSGSGYASSSIYDHDFFKPSYGALVNSKGLLMVSDRGNNIVRSINLVSGKVDTVAGNGRCASIDENTDMVALCDPKGLLYQSVNDDLLLVDSKNNIVRKFSITNNFVQTSTISNVSLEFVKAISQDSLGRIYISNELGQIIRLNNDSTSTDVLKAAQGSCIDGPAFNASVRQPESLSFNQAGDMIISDSVCRSIRKISGEQVSTLTGSGSDEFKDGIGSGAMFRSPFGIALGKNNVFYVADKNSHSIRRVSSNGQVTTLVGNDVCGYRNGPAADALLCFPNDVSYDNESNTLYIMDEGNSAVRSFSLSTYTMETVAGAGSPKYKVSDDYSIEFADLNAILITEVKIYLLDTKCSCILAADIDDMNSIRVIVGSGSYGWVDNFITQSSFNRPEDLAFYGDSTILFIADTQNHVIRKVDFNIQSVSTFAGDGKAGNELELLSSSFNQPRGIVIDNIFDIMYISDSGNHCIKVIEYLSELEPSISNLAGSQIRESGCRDGNFQYSLFSAPSGLYLDNRVLYVVDTHNHAVRALQLDAKTVETVAGKYAGMENGAFSNTLFNLPSRIVGKGRKLYVTDSGNHAIRVLDLELKITTNLIGGGNGYQDGILENALLNNPSGIALDKYGNIYFGDSGNQAIRVITTRPKVQTSKTSTIVKVPNALDDPYVILSISGGTAILLLTALAIFLHKRTQRKFLEIQKGNDLDRGPGSKRSSIVTEAIVISNSKAKHATLPSFFELSLKRAIKFPESLRMSSRGGAFNIVKAKLMDPEIISRCEIMDVSLKMINAAEDSQTVNSMFESFMYEIVILANLPKCDYLPQFVGFSGPPDMAIVVKDYPFALRDLLKDRSFFSNSDTMIKIATDVAKALEALHKAGIVHFDIKPSNIMIEYERNLPKCVISDFSFANFIADIGDKIVRGQKRPTALGISARYCAPELYQKTRNPPILSALHHKNHELDKKVDIYAYGATMYYVFTRTVPWNDKKSGEIEKLVLKGDRPTFPDPPIEQRISKIISQSWSQVPQDRLSATQVLELLKEIKTF